MRPLAWFRCFQQVAFHLTNKNPPTTTTRTTTQNTINTHTQNTPPYLSQSDWSPSLGSSMPRSCGKLYRLLEESCGGLLDCWMEGRSSWSLWLEGCTVLLCVHHVSISYSFWLCSNQSAARLLNLGPVIFTPWSHGDGSTWFRECMLLDFRRHGLTLHCFLFCQPLHGSSWLPNRGYGALKPIFWARPFFMFFGGV